MKKQALFGLCLRRALPAIVCALVSPGIAFAECTKADELTTFGTLYYYARKCPGTRWNPEIKTADLFAKGVQLGLLPIGEVTRECSPPFFVALGASAKTELEDPSQFASNCAEAVKLLEVEKEPWTSLGLYK